LVSRRISRRGLLGTSLGTLASLALPRSARGTDYASADEALAAIEGLEADVERFFLRLQRTLPRARAMIASFGRDRERHRRDRARVRRRLGLPWSETAAASEAAEASLQALRDAQSALVYAHAEALPAIGDAVGVGLLLGDLVDLARHLTVIDLWIETEAARG
jgi:hypothetical protein